MNGFGDSKEVIAALISSKPSTLPLLSSLQETVLSYCDLADLKTVTGLDDKQLSKLAKLQLQLHIKNLFLSPFSRLCFKSKLYIAQTFFNQINSTYIAKIDELERLTLEEKATIRQLEEIKQLEETEQVALQNAINEALKENLWNILNALYEQHQEFIRGEVSKFSDKNPLTLASDSIHWLQVVCVRPDPEIVFTLIEQGNDAMADYVTQLVAVPVSEINLLYWICNHTVLPENKQLRLIKIILASTDAERFLNWRGETPLQAALKQNNATVAEYLLEQKATNVTILDSSGNTPLATLVESNIPVARQYELWEVFSAHGVTKTALLKTIRRSNKPALLLYCLSHAEFREGIDHYLPSLLQFALHKNHSDLLEPLYRWHVSNRKKPSSLPQPVAEVDAKRDDKVSASAVNRIVHVSRESNVFFANILNFGYRSEACVRELIKRADFFNLKPDDIQALLLRLMHSLNFWIVSSIPLSSEFGTFVNNFNPKKYPLHPHVEDNSVGILLKGSFLFIFSCIYQYLETELLKLQQGQILNPTAHCKALYSLATTSRKALKQLKLRQLAVKLKDHIDENKFPYCALSNKEIHKFFWLSVEADSKEAFNLCASPHRDNTGYFFDHYDFHHKIKPKDLLNQIEPVLLNTSITHRQLKAIKWKLKRFLHEPVSYLGSRASAASPMPPSAPATASLSDAKKEIKKAEHAEEKIPQTPNEIKEFIRDTINGLAPVFARRAEAQNAEAALDAVVTDYHTNLNRYFLDVTEQFTSHTMPAILQTMAKQTADAIMQLTAIRSTRVLSQRKQQTFSRYHEALTMTHDMFDKILTSFKATLLPPRSVNASTNCYSFYAIVSVPPSSADKASPVCYLEPLSPTP
jgi:hypothetical protein